MRASRNVRSLATIAICLAALTGCETPSRDVPLILTCASSPGEPGFLNLDFIPSTYALADGENRSPPLQWTDGQEATAQWALVFEDRDADESEQVRWIIYNLPSYLRELPAGIPADSADLGREYFGARQGRIARNETAVGYRGPDPAPESGVHRYRLTLFALDAVLDIPAGVTISELKRAIDGHVLTVAVLDGKYGEPRPESPPRFPTRLTDVPENAVSPQSFLDSDLRGPGPPEPTDL